MKMKIKIPFRLMHNMYVYIHINLSPSSLKVDKQHVQKYYIIKMGYNAKLLGLLSFSSLWRQATLDMGMTGMR